MKLTIREGELETKKGCKSESHIRWSYCWGHRNFLPLW